MENNKRFEGKIGREYGLFGKAYPHFQELQKGIAEQIAKRSNGNPHYKVLELGCGPGPTSDAILSRNNNIILTALDNEEVMIAQARTYLAEYGNRVSVVSADALEFLKSTEDNKFNAVASAWTLHNFDQNYRSQVLREICRVLKPKGIFVNGDKYAQNNQEKHQQDFNWSIDQFIKEMAEKGHQDLCYEWIVHMGSDEDPKRLMKERESLSELEKIGFLNPGVIWRKRMEAIVTAQKGEFIP